MPSPQKYRYLVNHTTRQFVDKAKATRTRIHPLPILTCEGNGRGCGDYNGGSPLVGAWARHVISAEEVVDPEFEEISLLHPTYTSEDTSEDTH
jgi:hypothetical protein